MGYGWCRCAADRFGRRYADGRGPQPVLLPVGSCAVVELSGTRRTAALAGLVLATYVRAPSALAAPNPSGPRRLGWLGGFLSFMAVGCPVCNKAVLLLLGTSGALSYWAPLQPMVAIASVVLLAEAALRRLSVQSACPTSTSV